ncbi:MAG: glycosyltransferase family 4 protein [Actinobacteria bacterium]|nr:glycosyltransferase family 4 protein [Actinomycetota bacterium]
MRLVFVTQAIDAGDPNLAATVDKVRALAQRVDELVVICDRVLAHDLPANVSFRTFGAPTRLQRGARYVRALAPLLLSGSRPDAIFAHMCPIYLVLAAPLAKPLGVPLVLWYTHWDNDWTLRVATPLSSVALSVDRRSFPLPSEKVHGIGHGIDLSRFTPRASTPPAGNGPVRLLALGRTEPWKGLGTLLRGFELAVSRGLEGSLELRGPSVNDGERRHRAELLETIRSSDLLRGRATLEEPVDRSRVPELIRGADALVSPTIGRTTGGALDKVVYEASGCAVPVIACNPVLEEFLGDLPLRLQFRGGDAEDLAETLVAFSRSDRATREEVGRELRRRVEGAHSVESWADRVLAAVRAARRS